MTDPASQNFTLEYFERRAPSYRKKSAGRVWAAFRAREVAAVCALLAPRDGERVLDLGCGAGHYSIELKKLFSLDLMAVDSAPAMVREVAALGIPAWLGPAENFPETRRFDKILAAGMMEFVASPQSVFAKCARLLEADGKLVLLVPTSGWRGFLYRVAHELKGCPVSIRSAVEYARLARAEGFALHTCAVATPISMALEFRRLPADPSVTTSDK